MNFLNPREPVNTWTHALWLLIALVGIGLLWRRGRGDHAKQACLMIYGLCLILCSAFSTLYHGLRLSDRRIHLFEIMDHIGIFLLIAGTYTPIAWCFLRRRWRSVVLGLVWLWATLGITIRLSNDSLPPWLSTTLYMSMGWSAIFCYFEMSRRLSHREMLPIVAGGALYSVGAIFNLLRMPVIWPGVFEAHELFHVFVVAGSMCHFHFMLNVVGASGREPKPLPRSAVGSPAFHPGFEVQTSPANLGTYGAAQYTN